MAAQGFLLIATFLLVLMVLARPLGSGLARLINDIPLPGTTGVERVLFRALGVSDREMNWKQYLCAILGLNMLGLAVLFFMLLGQHYLPLNPQQLPMNWKQYLCAILGLNMLGLAVLFFMLLGQHYLPLNPQQLPGLSWDLALNTAVSFVTNTNWQSYSGETTLSYFSQMAGLTVQNFLSAASGIAVIFALIRAFTRQSMSTLGNAWVDLLRITLWVLVPVALLIALFFIQQGALQNFQPYQAVNTVEGAQQLLPMGPVASQEAIKMLGTNGGGFFNANSSHPFENPTALTNFVQMLAIFLIPTALCFAFGEVTGDRRQGRMLLWAMSHPFENPTALTNFVQMLAIFLIPTALCFAFGEVTGDRRQGRMLLWAMSVIFVICVGVVMWAEVQGNPHLLALGTDSSINMEGKESRFGVLVSSLFAVVTTAASCGAVIAMHDSFTALGGMVPMWLMQIGEVVFGCVGSGLYGMMGSGLYGMMLFVLLAVFIAGLMIGRTPEYLGKKIDVREMKLTALAILVTPTLVLMGAALAMMTDAGRSAMLNPGPHGFSEVLYAVSSAANNNGSATPTLVLMGAALAMMTDAGRSAMLNPGPHGFSEVLYAVSSAANNNGSAFAGLSANSPFWNCLLAFCMFVGRFGVIIPVMAIAGSLVSKKSQPASSGTLPTHGPLFVGLLIGTVLLVGALTFIPALALGPVAEYLCQRTARCLLAC